MKPPKDFMDLTIEALNKPSLDSLKKRPIPDGEYEVKFYDELDRGYGTESAVDEITVEFKDNELLDGQAFGIHHITDKEIEWTVYITDEEQEENIRTQVLIQLDRKRAGVK